MTREIKERFRLYALSRDWVRTRYYRPPPKKMVPSDLPPSQKWDNFSTEQYLSPLVPQILPPEPEIINQDWSQIDLLKFHLQRWKKVAQTWKEQSAGDFPLVLPIQHLLIDFFIHYSNRKFRQNFFL